MTYLEKPRWIDSEDQDRPFSLVLTPTREELDTAEPVQFSGEDESMEYAADFPCSAGDPDTAEDLVLIASADPLLDDPEWGAAKDQPEMKRRKVSIQSRLDTDS